MVLERNCATQPCQIASGSLGVATRVPRSLKPGGSPNRPTPVRIARVCASLADEYGPVDIDLFGTRCFANRDRTTDSVVRVARGLWEQWGHRDVVD